MREMPSAKGRTRLVFRAFSGATVEGDSRPHVLVCAIDNGKPVTRICLPASDATDASKVIRALLDSGLEYMDPSLLRRSVINALKETSRESIAVAVRNGWHGKRFVYHGRVFGKDVQPHLVVHQDFAPVKTGTEPPMNIDLIEFLDKAGPKSDFLVCATLIAFAQPLLGMLPSPERPVIYIWGESRTGKTTLATLINALSRPPSDRALCSFDATDRAFEEMLQSCSDNVAVFDELIVRQYAEIEPKLRPFIYMAANGRGKSRSKGANYPNLLWRTTTVVNGEMDVSPLRAKHRGSGQDARFIVLPVPKLHDGGIWTTPMPSEKRDKKMRALNRLCTTYCGILYQMWLGYLAANYDKVLATFEGNVQKHTLALAGEDADGVTRSRAQKYAQIIAAGDAVIKWGYIEWNERLPFDAVQRIYKADILPVDGAAKAPNEAAHLATKILAHVGLGAIPLLEGVDTIAKAYRRKWDGEEFVMIKKNCIHEFVTAPALEVGAAFKAAKASVTAGNSPFYQCKKSNTRYLRISMADLERLALGG